MLLHQHPRRPVHFVVYEVIVPVAEALYVVDPAAVKVGREVHQ
jgi:hypothetical protein